MGFTILVYVYHILAPNEITKAPNGYVLKPRTDKKFKAKSLLGLNSMTRHLSSPTMTMNIEVVSYVGLKIHVNLRIFGLCLSKTRC